MSKDPDPLALMQPLYRFEVRWEAPWGQVDFGRFAHKAPSINDTLALRIRVNQELEDIAQLMQDLPGLLLPGGVALCISFHSLEDRLIKRGIAEHARTCRCPPRLPVCICQVRPRLRPLPGGSQVAGEAERAANPRARSARLRGARRL